MIATALSVTNLELIAAQVVKCIFCLALWGGAAILLYKTWKDENKKRKIFSSVLAGLFIIISLPVIRNIIIEGSLLNSESYVDGITLGMCQVFARGNGIEFEYEINGIKYRNCNTFHPKPIREIIVPNGRYQVRYSESYPSKGRINFSKPIE